MPINIDRIISLANDPAFDAPDITDEQAGTIVRLLAGCPLEQGADASTEVLGEAV